MKITAIKQQVKDKNRASIYIDGRYGFSLDLDQLIAEKLKLGLDLENGDLLNLKKKSADGKLRTRVIEWLSIRPRSIQELRIYLKRKNCDTSFADHLIAEMAQKKYLSDEKFAKWFTELKSRQLKSTKEIRYLLIQKGVDAKIIESTLDEAKESEIQRLLSIVEKKRKTTKYRDNDKLLEYLIRKGYSFSEVKEALADG